MSRDRAKFTATLHAEQQKVQIGLIGDASVSEELQKKNHLSTLKFDSFESVNLDRVPSPREPLLERNWIEQHLEYTRRYNLTDDAVASAADFRRQNKEECLAGGDGDNAENYLLIAESDESFQSEDQFEDPKKDADKYRPNSPNPYDLKDDRIKDYTVNHRLFPVPLFPENAAENLNPASGKKLPSTNYVRISVPSRALLPEYQRELQNTPVSTEDSLCLWEHCVKGHRQVGQHKKASSSKNKLDLRSHLNPADAVDVYKIKSGQSFKFNTREDPFDISKLNLAERR